MAQEVHCQECRFWREITGRKMGSDQVLGACHRYPKRIEKWASDWCGEYQAEAKPLAVPAAKATVPTKGK